MSNYNPFNKKADNPFNKPEQDYPSRVDVLEGKDIGDDNNPDHYFDYIKGSEGLHLKKYWDKRGWSIGYGHFLRKGENFDEGITKEKAMDLYRSDTTEKIDYLRGNLGEKAWGRLPRKVKGALIDLDYRGDYRGSPKFQKLFKQGKYVEAASELEDHKEAKKSKGVGKRIARNANVIRDFGLRLSEYNEQLEKETPKEPFSDFINEVQRQLGSQ